MLQPKRTKHRKQMKSRNRGFAQRGNSVAFGDFALQATELGNLTSLLRKVEPAIKRETITVLNRTSKNDDFVYNVTQLNVLETMKYIENSSEIIKTLIAEGKIKIVGGLYDLETRRVSFIEPTQTARIVMPPPRLAS